MSTNYIAYLQRIVNDPATPRAEYMRAWEELRHLEAHQRYVNEMADAYHNGNDNLTKGHYV